MSESRDPATPGDEAAVDELMERYLPRLRAFVRLRMGPQLRAKESASDLVQSACRDVLEHMDRYRHRGEANFRQWLFMTALRKVKRKAAYYGAARRDAAREVRPATGSDEQLAECYRTLSTPSRQLMLREQVERFEGAMERLPENYREVILLCRVVGLPHRAVAETLGKSEEATRSLLRRALAALAAELERS